MIFFTTFYQLVDINVLRTYHGILLFHYFGCSMEEDLIIFLFGQVLILICLATLLDDNLIKFEFNGLSFNYFLFNCVLRNETIDKDFLLLANSVRSIHGLEIDLWVPVGVENDDLICCIEIDS